MGGTVGYHRYRYRRIQRLLDRIRHSRQRTVCGAIPRRYQRFPHRIQRRHRLFDLLGSFHPFGQCQLRSGSRLRRCRSSLVVRSHPGQCPLCRSKRRAVAGQLELLLGRFEQPAGNRDDESGVYARRERFEFSCDNRTRNDFEFRRPEFLERYRQLDGDELVDRIGACESYRRGQCLCPFKFGPCVRSGFRSDVSDFLYGLHFGCRHP